MLADSKNISQIKSIFDKFCIYQPNESYFCKILLSIEREFTVNEQKSFKLSGKDKFYSRI